MAVVDVVTVLRALTKSEADFEQRFGAQALTAAQDMRDVVIARLQIDLSDDGLWEEFSADPSGTQEELTGTIEAMIEADPELAMQLGVLLREFEETRERGTEPEEVLPGGQENGLAPPEEEEEELEADIPETVTKLAGDQYNEEGTYLRGNVDLGAASIDARPVDTETLFDGERPVEEDSLVIKGQEDMGVPQADPAEIIGAGMYEAVQTHPGLDDETRDALRAELRVVMEQVRQGDCADRDLLIAHLERMCGISGDLMDLLLMRLTDPDASLGLVVPEAAQAVRERMGGEKWPDEASCPYPQEAAEE